jgi:murein DD-endopeptidase MepM/ murein hydrolase activator NlpD
LFKRTSSQTIKASWRAAVSSLAVNRKKTIACSLAIVAMLATTFFLGRESVSMPGDFASAIKELHASILLQQRDVDRLIQSNRSNINALAVRMAELQAASTRIDALGERLAKMGQLTLDEFDFTQVPALGGPANPLEVAAASEGDLQASVGLLGEKLRRQASQLDALQFLMVNRQIEDDLTPAGWPVRKGWISSKYGERTDPFTGERAQHDGLDFVAARGSDVLSVANGVVVWAGKRNGYGNTIEIDHGNGYRTRYAHNESMLVEPGTQVSAGQLIAKLGSSGRTSTPHVHFEVLQNGVAVNPAKFVGQLR